MEPRKPSPPGEFRPKPPRWTSPLWYLPLMVLLLWFWQTSVSQFSYRSIPYSEFKACLNRHEVAECLIREDDIEGKIKPKAPMPAEKPNTTNSAEASASSASASSPKSTAADATKPFLFRTVRVEDPKLVEELQAAGVKFSGERPSLIAQFLVSWILPIGIMVLIWSFIGRRLGSAGESILSFGKSKA